MRKLILVLTAYFSTLNAFSCDKNQAADLAEKLELEESKSCEILDETFDAIKHQVEENEEIQLANFGTFTLKNNISFQSHPRLTNVLREREDLVLYCHQQITLEIMSAFKENFETSCYYVRSVLDLVIDLLKSNPKRTLVIPHFGRFRLKTNTTLKIRNVARWFPQDVHISYRPW